MEEEEGDLLIFASELRAVHFTQALSAVYVSSLFTEQIMIKQNRFGENLKFFTSFDLLPETILRLCLNPRFQRIVLFQPPQDIVDNTQHEKVLSVADADECFETLQNYELSGEQKQQIRDRVFGPIMARGIITRLRNPVEFILNLLDLELARPGDPMDEAIANSMQTYEEENRRKRERTPLVDEDTSEIWKKRLKIAADNVRDENDDEIEEEKACNVCLTRLKTITVVPCCHEIMCAVCAMEIMENDDLDKKCPVCLQKIEMLISPIK